MTLQDKIYHTEQMANAIQRREEFYTLEILESAESGYSPETTLNVANYNSEGVRISSLKHIELPAPQVAGTMVQRRSYAMGKAMDILNTLSL